MRYKTTFLVATAAIAVSHAANAQDAAQGATDTSGLTDIVVTAQKRTERIFDVPLSINAVSGDQLTRQGVNSAKDLERVVPGFTYRPTPYGGPVFSIRGVGFYETTMAIAPAVTVYLDQVPLPYLSMAEGASFDLERVEALKGPQGTLFGQNSTGGAINYIAAKPTKELTAKFNAEYGRFNEFNLDGAVSGPLTSNLRVRLAVRHESRGDWQRSYTRNDSLGKRDFTTGRFLVEWEPSDTVKLALNLNAWQNRSETQAAQYRQFSALLPPPAGSTTSRDALANYPFAPFDIRSADWDQGMNLKRDDRFYQASLRADIAMGDLATLTSITAYSDLKAYTPTDSDGVNFQILPVIREGYAHSFSQEVRVANNDGPFKWVVGANTQIDDTFEKQIAPQSFGSNQQIGPFPFNGFQHDNGQKIDSWAGFGGVDVKITPTLSLQGSLRYTDQVRRYAGCTRDLNGGLADAMGFFATIFSGIPTTFAKGSCITLTDAFRPAGIVHDRLAENNLSWRVGATWKPEQNVMLYANVTRGYKAGAFATLPALKANQLTPVPQESLLAYEAGFKISALRNKVQLTGAGFYYDYTDKQILGTVNVGIPFGSLPGLVTIPKSSVRGGEIELRVNPVRPLTLSVGATYVDSRVDDNFITPDPYGTLTDIKGEAFPNTPKWQVVANAELRQPINESLDFTLGGGMSYRSASYSTLGRQPLFLMQGYTLFDARVGLAAADGKWSATLWGRNITDKRYVVTSFKSLDTVAELTGMPATYGLLLSFRY